MQRYAGLYDIDAVCLSHLHADHCLDVCAYSVARTFHRTARGRGSRSTGRPGRGAARPRARRRSRGAGRPAGTGHRITDAFSFATLTPGVMAIGPLRVTAAHMNHPVETFGFRLEHAGRSLAYSADTGQTEALPDLARDADLLLCEASFPRRRAPRRPPPEGLHLTARQAGEHAARAGAGQLLLTHLVPWNDRERLARPRPPGASTGPLTLAASGPGFVLD